MTDMSGSVIRHSLRPTSAILTASVLIAGLAAPASAEVACERGNVRVVSESPETTQAICTAAADAIAVLSSMGIRQTCPVFIDIVDEVPRASGPDTVGCYDWSRDRVYVRSFDILAMEFRGRTSLRVALDDDVYASYVAHEVAHAVSAHAFTFAPPSLAAQEYIAGVVQIATLAPEQRQRILDRFDGDGFDAPSEIHLYVYLVDPGRFAVESYRHYVKHADGPEFVAGLLSGEIRLQDRLPY